MSHPNLRVLSTPEPPSDAQACVEKIFSVGREAYERLEEVMGDDDALEASLRGLTQSELGAADLYAGAVRADQFMIRMLIFEDGRRSGLEEAMAIVEDWEASNER